MIPKRIICTHVSRSAINPMLQHCVANIEALHPGWEVSFYSDGDCLDFVERNCPQYAEIYRWYPRAVLKADFFRVLAVYHLGGFYLDTDVWLTQNLEPLRTLKAVFPWEREMGHEEMSKRYPASIREKVRAPQVGNYAFGAEAGHPFLQALLEEMVRRTATFEAEFCSDLDVLRATGPDLVTTVYYRGQKQWKDVEVLKGASYLSGPQPPVSRDSPKHWQRFGSFGSHLLAGGWKS